MKPKKGRTHHIIDSTPYSKTTKIFLSISPNVAAAVAWIVITITEFSVPTPPFFAVPMSALPEVAKRVPASFTIIPKLVCAQSCIIKIQPAIMNVR